MSNNTDTCEKCYHHKENHGFMGCIITQEKDGAVTFCECDATFPDVKSQLPEAGRTIPSRNTDPGTSHAAARSVSVRAGTQRAKLLLTFYVDGQLAEKPGLTDEEAMEMSEGVSPVSEFAKRCSELRDAGLIEPTGETRKGNAGVDRIVSAITDKGRTVARSLA
jgi:hypothetical protein